MKAVFIFIKVQYNKQNKKKKKHLQKQVPFLELLAGLEPATC